MYSSTVPGSQGYFKKPIGKDASEQIIAMTALARLRFKRGPSPITGDRSVATPMRLLHVLTQGASLRPVNLRSLQTVGVIHVNCFPLAVKVNCADAAFAMAIACGFDASEWQVH